ncbi:LysR family transcriptional regulator [Neptunicoccus cionae]|uniref:LysR family transcriptional regulator n=1 Tax=Neptunicoccus cionae TaxID=2035344 RepID=A0A916QYR9_9RHOB|nr:LysR family transcriptional regulator [Amylibacter cionae]GGA20161.1 LysR family transcriptional regulator [Amylibacter cionae]
MSFSNIMVLRPNYTPSIPELRALVFCGDLGSVSRAAEALNLTQSAVSRSVRSLEERLGVQLFHRVRKRLHLSDAGRAMVHESREILAALDRSARMTMAFGEGGDVLRLAVLPTLASTWLIPRLPEFLASHPDVSIDLTSALHPVDFDESPFDAALQRAVMARKGAEVGHLLDETLIIVAAPRLVDGMAELSAEQLAGYPLIQLATRPELWNDWFSRLGTPPPDRLRGPRVQHFDMVISAAAAGLGVALLPDIFVQSALATGSLRQIHSQRLEGPTPYALIRPAGRQPSTTMQSFTNWLHNTAAKD